ncbi:CCR4-NOT transcription complex subunit 9 [Frankliniella fusca]|uniref:CCR4-NOT transcription complex subunit 9 n=1 Tax=Frankliniella fusca TaxID=407009 RepID=A0AAE1GZ68_9NEOP|nr:CCR4-NOT transcription complex subunit 9 [Frankliniella fusca]
MEELDVDNLALALMDYLPLPIVNALKGQQVSGSCFMSLNESTLKLFDFPIGHIFAIMKVISQIKEGKIVLQASSSENIFFSERTPSNSVLTNINQNQSIKEVEGLPHTSSPTFSDIPLKFLKCSTQSKGDDAGKKSASRKGKNSNFSLSSCESGDTDSDNTTETSKPKTGETSEVKRTSSRTRQPSSKSKVTPNISSSTSSQKQKRVHSSNNTESTSDSDESGNSDACREEGQRAKVTSFNPPLPLRTIEELRNISPSLPSFDIESILLDDENSKERTKNLVPLLKEGKLLGSKERKRIFRKLVNHLCFKHVDDPSKATALMREGLAKSMVVTYPQYQKAFDVEGKTPWSYIWSVQGGHINNVIKRIQTALPDSKRVKKGKVVKRKKKKLPSCNVDPKQLSLLMPDRVNRAEIFDGMKKTFPLRSLAREKGSSITEILSEFPHLLNYSGELIGAEYQEMFPNSKDMCPDMAKFVPKVLKNWDDNTIEVKCKDDDFKACLILALKLPHRIRSKSTIPQEEELIVLVQPGVDLEGFVAERRMDGKGKPIQPYLLGLRGQITTEILKYFLVLDGNLLELGRIPFLRCIDWLFKTYVVFNVNYPSTWAQFFRFLQTCFYKIYFSSNDDIPPSSVDLFNKLAAL